MPPQAVPESEAEVHYPHNFLKTHFLSRTLKHHIGEGRRFPNIDQQASFSKALASYCEESAVMVQKFSGDWLSKTRWEHGGISRGLAVKFTSVAMRKLLDGIKEGTRPYVG